MYSFREGRVVERGNPEGTKMPSQAGLACPPCVNRSEACSADFEFVNFLL